MSPEEFKRKHPNAGVRRDTPVADVTPRVVQRPTGQPTTVKKKRPTRDEFLQQKRGQPDHSFKTDTGTIHCGQAVKLHGCSDKKVEQRCRYECGKKRVEDLREEIRKKQEHAKRKEMEKQEKLFSIVARKGFTMGNLTPDDALLSRWRDEPGNT